MFNNLKDDSSIQGPQDNLGGGNFSRVETDVYPATIKAIYGIKSAGGALGVVLSADIGQKNQYSETIYVTNKKEENFYLVMDKTKTPWVPVMEDDPENPGKKRQVKRYMAGYTLINDLCLIVTGKPLAEQVTEEKTMMVYDKDAGKEVQKKVDMLVDLLEAQVELGIVKQLVFQQEKNGNGDYVDTEKTREENVIEKVYQAETKMTVLEAINNGGWDASKALYQPAWLAKNKAVTRDRTQKKGGATNGIKTGRPGASAPTANGGSGAPKPAGLFGNKG